LAILLFILLWATVRENQPHFYLLAASLVAMIFITFAVNFKRLNFTWPHLLLPTIYLLGAVSVFVVITNPTIRLIFLLVACGVFYFLEFKLGRESHFLQNIYLLSGFAMYVGLFAVQFYFNLKIWMILPLVFLITYLLAIQGLAGFSLPAKKYFYLLTAIVATEACWGLTFWPTHFFANAVVLFSIFYLIWLFAFSAFFGKLSRQKIYWQLILVVLVLTLTLSTTPWRPLR
jgi:hypothetical protein